MSATEFVVHGEYISKPGVDDSGIKTVCGEEGMSTHDIDLIDCGVCLRIMAERIPQLSQRYPFLRDFLIE